MVIAASSALGSLARFLAPFTVMGRARTRHDASVQLVSLPLNGTFDVERPFGCCIQCLRGSIWITHVGDGRDVVIAAGTSFIGDRCAPMFIQALVPAEFSVASKPAD